MGIALLTYSQSATGRDITETNITNRLQRRRVRSDATMVTKSMEQKVTAAEKKRMTFDADAYPTSFSGKSPIKGKKLGHLVYQVSDIDRSVKFWTEVMGFTETDRNDLGMVFFRCGTDHHGIGLVPRPGLRRPASNAGLHVEHLAVEVENTDVLLQAREYLIENNIPIRFEGRKGAGCNYSINFLDPDGYEFEIYCNMDQIDESGRLRPKAHFLPKNTLAAALANPVPDKW
jgi:catechol 2,3-dioxygenase-like lactoylglutathione lyase family enzyme